MRERTRIIPEARCGYPIVNAISISCGFAASPRFARRSETGTVGSVRSIREQIDTIFFFVKIRRNSVAGDCALLPGFHVSYFHRFAPPSGVVLGVRVFPSWPRFLSQLGRFFTESKIHPGGDQRPALLIDTGLSFCDRRRPARSEKRRVNLPGRDTWRDGKGKRASAIAIVKCSHWDGCEDFGNIQSGDHFKIGAWSVCHPAGARHSTVIGHSGPRR